MQDKLQNTNYIVFDDQTVFSYARLNCDEIVAFFFISHQRRFFSPCLHHSKHAYARINGTDRLACVFRAAVSLRDNNRHSRRTVSTRSLVRASFSCVIKYRSIRRATIILVTRERIAIRGGNCVAPREIARCESFYDFLARRETGTCIAIYRLDERKNLFFIALSNL